MGMRQEQHQGARALGAPKGCKGTGGPDSTASTDSTKSTDSTDAAPGRLGGVSRGLWLYEPVGAVSTWARFDRSRTERWRRAPRELRRPGPPGDRAAAAGTAQRAAQRADGSSGAARDAAPGGRIVAPGRPA